MAYQGYSDQPANQGGPSPYGQAGNPYDEDTSYGGGNPYAQGQYDARPGQNNYEMSNMNSSDPNRILNECRQIDAEVDALDARLQHLEQLQTQYLGNPKPQEDTAVRSEGTALLEAYRVLIGRTKRVKQDKDSGNPRNAPQVGRIDRKVKTSMNNFQKSDSKYRQKLQDRIERDYRIVRPDASDAEVREATQDPTQQVFSQALISSDRRGEAQSAAKAVKSRHDAIKKIEQDMLELAQMFQDLDALVVQQEAQVTQIEQRGEEVKEDVRQANTQLDGAVTKARAARKKKWICLGIAAAVIVVIIIIVAIIVSINNSRNKNNNTASTAARLLMTL